MVSYILSSSVLAIMLTAGAVIAPVQRDSHNEPGMLSSALQAPNSVRAEHKELRDELSALTKLGGKTGPAAQRVATLLHAHFAEEEEFALPPLALLRPLANGHASPDMRSVITLTDRLKAGLPRMLGEHKAIVAALGELRHAAETEGHPQAVRFAEKLTLHAQNEEEVLYPAALLVGEFLKLKYSH